MRYLTQNDAPVLFGYMRRFCAKIYVAFFRKKFAYKRRFLLTFFFRCGILYKSIVANATRGDTNKWKK